MSDAQIWVAIVGSLASFGLAFLKLGQFIAKRGFDYLKLESQQRHSLFKEQQEEVSNLFRETHEDSHQLSLSVNELVTKVATNIDELGKIMKVGITNLEAQNKTQVQQAEVLNSLKVEIKTHDANVTGIKNDIIAEIKVVATKLESLLEVANGLSADMTTKVIPVLHELQENLNMKETV